MVHTSHRVVCESSVKTPVLPGGLRVCRHLSFYVLCVAFVGVTGAPGVAAEGDFYAYHTRAKTSADAGAGRYADLIVVLGDRGRLEFLRSGGYRPQWRTGDAVHAVDDLYPDRDPDPHCDYAYVRLMNSSSKKIVVHWRHFPDLRTLVRANRAKDVLTPHGITGVVHELFTVYPDGRVEREIRSAHHTRYQDWINPKLATRQVLHLKNDGVRHGRVIPGAQPPFGPRPAVQGNPVKAGPPNLPRPIHRFTFDEGLEPHFDAVRDHATEKETESLCPILGLMTLFKPGVSGTALAFDGYYTGVKRESSAAKKAALTVEGWLALDAYPYNIAPLAHQSSDLGERGWYLGLDAYGHPLLTVSGKTVMAKNVVLPLHQWVHLAATVDSGRARLFVDGREVAVGDVDRQFNTPGTPVLLGLNNTRQRNTDTVRGDPTNIPFCLGLPGLLDEVCIYDQAFTAEQVKLACAAMRPANAQSSLKKGVLPGELGKAERFGAAYKNLAFSEVWDRLWRPSQGAEIVVKFEDQPCSVVYWRGTNFAPNWVTDNNRWMADQSSEIGGPHGCSEHMSDKQTRHSYARIIENTPARVLMHWRYPCVDVGYNCESHRHWTDEYHVIYPDGTGVRQVVWNGGTDAPGFQDIQFLTNPGETALDVMHLQAMTVANLDGQTKALTWQPPNRVPRNDLPGACIEWLNSKSRYKVFAVFQDGHINPWGHREQSRYTSDPFAGPWNHWPMHLAPSDGRYAVAHDRVTHFAIGANDGARRSGLVLYGFTKQPIKALVPLARMWRHPPALRNLQGAESGTFDNAQKAYRFDNAKTPLSFTLDASAEQPLANPCFVLRGWNRPGQAVIRIDGKPFPGIRQGIVRDTDGSRMLIAWFEMQSSSPTTFSIRSEAD